MKDPRAGLALYYDLDTTFPHDIPFYLEQLASPKTTVLELGCGTGRVSVPIARHSARFVGVEHSAEMAGTCERRLAEADLSSKARVVMGDITDLSLADRFELIVAPFSDCPIPLTSRRCGRSRSGESHERERERLAGGGKRTHRALLRPGVTHANGDEVVFRQDEQDFLPRVIPSVLRGHFRPHKPIVRSTGHAGLRRISWPPALVQPCDEG